MANAAMKEFAKPLLWTGVALGAFGGFATFASVSTAIERGEFSNPAAFFVPLLFFLAGAGLVVLAVAMRRGGRIEVGHIAFWSFGAAGLFCVFGGLSAARDDPAGLLVVALGAVFIAAGWCGRKRFATPKGMIRVAVETLSATVSDRQGKSRVLSETYVFIPKDADEAAVVAARRDWAEAALRRRPDWLSGRIEPEATRGGATMRRRALIVAGLTLVFAALGWFAATPFYLMAGLAAAVALAFAWKATGQAARRRKFGDAVFAMKAFPVAPGDPVDGVIETKAPRRALTDGAFRVTLTCERSLRYLGRDETRTRTDALWSDAMTVRAAGETALTAPVRFDTPADLPGATLARGGEARVTWLLTVEADAQGVDFRADFTLPVIATADAAPGDHGTGA